MDLGDLAGRWLAKQIKQKARTSHSSPRQQTATIRSLMSRSPGLPPVCPGGGPLSDRPYKAEVGGSIPPAPTRRIRRSEPVFCVKAALEMMTGSVEIPHRFRGTSGRWHAVGTGAE